jgi:hypothetical protein
LIWVYAVAAAAMRRVLSAATWLNLDGWMMLGWLGELD